jgi:hypothetical protein
MLPVFKLNKDTLCIRLLFLNRNQNQCWEKDANSVTDLVLKEIIKEIEFTQMDNDNIGGCKGII